jgi:ABC-2 type transport system permease protein
MMSLKSLKLNKIFTITKYTFLDLYKSRILLNCLFLGILLLAATILASEFTYGTPEKVALDFGLGVTSISTVAIAIFMGVSLIANEIESRTIYLVLSRNIGRSDFIIVKV